jgi:hypothetical protein
MVAQPFASCLSSKEAIACPARLDPVQDVTAQADGVGEDGSDGLNDGREQDEDVSPCHVRQRDTRFFQIEAMLNHLNEFLNDGTIILELLHLSFY